MVAFTGVCRVHRAEIMQLRGAWQDAIEEAQRARERSAGVRPACRRRGALPASRSASAAWRVRGGRGGLSPCKRVGMRPAAGAGVAVRGARTRGGRGRRDRCGAARNHRAPEACAAAARRVEITLAVGDVDEARRACDELEDIAASFDSGELDAIAAYARAALELATGDAQAALVSAQRAVQVWQSQRSAVHDRARARTGGVGVSRPRRLSRARDWNSMRPGPNSNGWVRRRTWRASTRSPTAPQRRDRTD